MCLLFPHDHGRFRHFAIRNLGLQHENIIMPRPQVQIEREQKLSASDIALNYFTATHLHAISYCAIMSMLIPWATFPPKFSVAESTLQHYQYTLF